MNLYVLDASAWLRLFLGDGPMPDGLVVAAAAVERGEAGFAAPELILVEAAHALHRKVQRGVLSVVESDALWEDMRRTPLDLLSAEAHMPAAREMARRLKLSVYDALYAAVAAHLGARLFTADEALTRAMRSSLG